MNSEVLELVKNAGNLISLPEISIRITEMVDDPGTNAEEIGNVISQDPMLAARLLKMANSPFYGLTTQVDTITRAITILGMNTIRELVLSTEVSHAFDGIPNDLISMRDFWHHSLYCAILAKILAKQSKKLNPDTMFISGLLHDIGQLVMFNRFPDKARETIISSIEGPEELEMHQAEQQVYGYDHAEVGAALAKEWHLPENITTCIEYHHKPTEARQFKTEVALVHIANAAAVMAELNAFDDAELPEIDPVCWDVTSLDKKILAADVEQAQKEIAEIESILFSA